MSFFVYLFIFFMINRVMYLSPLLGMLLYGVLIWFAVSNNRKRMRAYAQRQQAYSQQQSAYQNSSSQQQGSDYEQKNTSSQVKKDVIDVEFSEEEIN